ncbi:PspC domain-containing protein [Microbacterium sp. ARD32]|uniref:PspC domain-containing protein n=1 Tax=Microbacterium sp. ARD32 TaxID=2962577 RepID=UPI0028829187|nr:PspC domain-containing protein [Microbacterium sp. ARD32]MDT0158326.1 PspC domain-containing protein [Microbacterium sp. ARD32]
MNPLVRPRQDRLIAGVCSAVARRFGISSTTVRIITVLAVLFAGLSLWAYVLLWIVIPNEF